MFLSRRIQHFPHKAVFSFLSGVEYPIRHPSDVNEAYLDIMIELDKNGKRMLYFIKFNLRIDLVLNKQNLF